MQKDSFLIRNFPSLDIFFHLEAEQQSLEKGTKKLRVCIATEEIFGPVRNGGIASTYFHLARILAQQGHNVTVLYLKGRKSENETIEHWIDFYGKLGVDFVPLPHSGLELICSSERWQRPMYDFYYWLKGQEPFDLVHASEWRGGPYYCLLAKQQGLAFEHTLFAIKSSSPWIWNRHYGMQMVNITNKLTVMFAERKSIELADIVIGGSAHLLSFMEYKGYKLPPGRTFVQPNIVDLEDLEVEEERPNYQYGDLVKSNELVFFGRLEARKGLEIFCDAIDSLIEQKAKLPKLITFMGKQGNRLPSRPDITSIEFIGERTSQWPFEVKVIDSYDRDKAIGYLCSKPKIAVMPSLIENSTMAVYECLVQKIPFIASNSGGTPELVDRKYRDIVLCEAHPRPLAAKLSQVLNEGAVVAKGAFDYESNLATWKQFHDHLAVAIQHRGIKGLLNLVLSHSLETNTGNTQSISTPLDILSKDNSTQQKISVCIYHYKRPQFLESLLNSLLLQSSHFDEIVVVNDGAISGQTKKILKKFKDYLGESHFQVIQTDHCCIGEAMNSAASVASGNLLVFMNAECHYAKKNFIEVLRKVAHNSSAEAFTFSSDYFQNKCQPSITQDGQTRALPLGGDLATAYYLDGSGGSCFMIRKPTFESIGGFFESYHIAGVEHEFYTRLMLAGHNLEFVPESLYWERQVSTKINYNLQSSNYLAILPFLQSVPNYMENILLVARDLHKQVTNLKADKKKLQEQRKKLTNENVQLRQQIKKLSMNK